MKFVCITNFKLSGSPGGAKKNGEQLRQTRQSQMVIILKEKRVPF